MSSGVYKRSKEHIAKSIKHLAKSWEGGTSHPSWKGDKASYNAIHKWVYTHFKKKNICSLCKEVKKTCWANKTGLYKREENDWIELCYQCHWHFDRENPKKHRYLRYTLRKYRNSPITSNTHEL